MTLTLPPFRTTSLAACTHLLSNVMRDILSHLILTLSWCLKKKSDHDEKSLHHHTTPSFASSKSPFWLHLGLWETPRASHPDTEVIPCLWRNQCWATQAAWVQCEPSIPRRDSKTGDLARSNRRRALPFIPSHCAARAIGHICQVRFVIQAEKRQSVPCKPPGERELGVV